MLAEKMSPRKIQVMTFIIIWKTNKMAKFFTFEKQTDKIHCVKTLISAVRKHTADFRSCSGVTKSTI